MPEPTCGVCGQPGLSRVCATDGVDLVCHSSDCDTAVCARCQVRADAAAATQSEEKPQSRDLVEPCPLKVRLGCDARKADAEAARKAYKFLELASHSAKSFCADVFFGHFESARLAGEAPLAEPDDFRHLARCWTCSPPRPRSAAQWCIHPRELWQLREKAGGGLSLPEMSRQIHELEEAWSNLKLQIPPAAVSILTGRLHHLIEIARAVDAQKDAT